ncbi:MAG: NUDIX domain-containing protein [Phycisphaerales bacterium]|nr:NUDIX domain-containing protein [Phycisphaerales bacterium]
MTAETGRVIRLRRPPVFNVVPDRWIPQSIDLESVDDAWAVLSERNPRYHDGDVLHVLGVVRNGHGGAIVHLAPSSYRFHAVRAMGIDTGIRTLGLKGLCVVNRGGEAGLIAGRRSDASGSYPGMWEYLPGGGVPPESDGSVRPDLVFKRELKEECGVPSSGEAIPIAMLRDDVVGTWEVVYRCTLASSPTTSPGWEHDELALVTPATLPEPSSDAARAMAELAEVVLGDVAT